ncbi:MAG: WbqC family protein [Cyclobacteriaceae bacterium]|nr:WbqC family protein [Cyclobacteriaceae bacterium]
MSSKKLLIDLQYLPPLEYFCLMSRYEEIHLEAHEHFVKQTYRNRCYILGPNKSVRLIVPVYDRSKKVLSGEVRIDHSQKWAGNHWRSLESSYGKSAFFIHYSEMFEEIIRSKTENLFELNFKLLTLCLHLLGWKKKLVPTRAYEKSPKNNEYDDFRDYITPKDSHCERQIYTPKKYFQLFGKTFAENLSIIDLLFSEGTHSGKVLDDSTRLY